jgi:signal transduction histidine kinase
VRAKVLGGDPADAEKARAAERQIAIVRLFVVVTNSLVYLFLMGGSRSAPGLPHLVIAFALAYTACVLWFEPYRKYPRLFSGTFTSVADAVLILVWLYATGGASSPFYLLIYLSVTAVAFRYGYRQTAFAALVYSGSYLGLLLALGGSAVGVADIVVRVAYVAPFALLAALMSRELSRHLRSRVELAERLKRDTELAERRSRFLAEASALLTSSLDGDQIPERVARLVVPFLGDNCVVDVVDDDNNLRRMAEASADPAQEQLLRRLRDFAVATGGERSPVRKAIDTGEVVVIPKFDDSALRALQRGGEYEDLIRRIGPTSSVTVPLQSRGRALGAITFGMAGSGRSHSADDIALAADLAHRAALAMDNANLYRQARQAIGARDAFLSIASHELRNPLSTLGLQAQRLSRLIARDPGRGPLDALARGTDKIAEQTRRLDRMIGLLLDVSRIATDHLDLDLQEVDLMTVVTDVIECFDEESARTGSAISVTADDRSVTGRWDPMRLDQIVTNLVGNAVKYGAGRPIQVEVARAYDRARVIVQDQGIGIAREQQPRLFQRFERLVDRDSPAGLGLGLWITRRLVEAMGGSIAVESELGRGARFIVELPRGDVIVQDRR